MVRIWFGFKAEKLTKLRVKPCEHLKFFNKFSITNYIFLIFQIKNILILTFKIINIFITFQIWVTSGFFCLVSVFELKIINHFL